MLGRDGRLKNRTVLGGGHLLLRLVPAVLALGLVGVLGWQTRPASGQQATATVKLVAPASVSPGAASFQVRVEVEGVPPPAAGCEGSDDFGLCGLASYEWQLVYDPAIVEVVLTGVPPGPQIVDGGFLGSTGRTVTCQPPILPPAVDPGNLRFGCTTSGPTPLPPSGTGILSTVAFRPVAVGNATIGLAATTGLADTWGEAIPSAHQGACTVIGTGSCATPTPLPTATPVTPGPTNTPGPAEPTATPTLPPQPGEPTATPTTPPQPAATPSPLPAPLPGQREQIQLVTGCNLRSFQPQYAPGTELIFVVVDISAGNPRLWFQVEGSPFFDLYDFRSVERSTKTVLGTADEAGFICLDTDAVWSRPVLG